MSPPRILSVAYDLALLETRAAMLAHRGYDVTSAWGFQQAISQCSGGEFDLFILGHSIPSEDKAALIRAFRENCRAPVLSLRRPGEDRVAGADFHADAQPEALLATVADILRR